MDLIGTRICIVGTSGSGKTTLASYLAVHRGLRHIELDEFWHQPGWTTRAEDDFRRAVDESTKGDGWVADGNYSKVFDLTLERADTLIWLDFPLIVPLWRVTKRCFVRGLKREELWHGNRESLWTHLFTRDSLILWVLATHQKRKRKYAPIFEKEQGRGLHLHRIKNQNDLANLMRSIRSAEPSCRPK